MTPLERIKANAERYTKDEGYQRVYIAGATAENSRAQGELKEAQDAAKMFCNKHNETATQLAELVDRAQVLVDALEALTNQLPTGNPLNSYFAKEQVIEARKALEQWKGKGKAVEQTKAKEGIIRVILAGAYEVSKDAASAEEYLKSEGVDVAQVKANAQYFTWKAELIRITKEKTGESGVKINDEEAVKWYNDGFTPEQTFRETWQSDGD